MPSSLNHPSEKHIGYLDSARGIASLMVFVMHFFERKYIGRPINNYLSMIFNGRDAVSFFFVLSGFVLSYKYIVLKKPLDLKKFYISRFFRLWPAFFVTLIINCLYAFYQHNVPWTAHKLVEIFILNRDNFWEEAFLIRFHNIYYGAGWTLTIEMVGSFLLPFFILSAIKNKQLVYYLIFIFAFIVGQNYYSSLHFLLGVLISCYYFDINQASFRQRKWFKYRYLILLIAIAIWPIRYYDALSPFGHTYKYLAEYFGIDFFYYTAISSAVFLVIIIHYGSVQKFLGNKLLIFIGKLSYSIYLVHLFAINIIYDCVEKAIPSKNPNIVVISMIVGYIILTFTLAALMHYFVEIPFMSIGKRIASKMKPSVIIVNGNTENI